MPKLNFWMVNILHLVLISCKLNANCFCKTDCSVASRVVGSQGTARRGPWAWPAARVGGLACSPCCQGLLPEGQTHA